MAHSIQRNSLLARLGSLGAIGAGALLLLADSADPRCEDGYNAVRFAARFTSTCPASFAPPSGILRLELPKDGLTVAEPLRVSGISATGEIATDGGSVCTPTSLRITSNALTCSSIDLNPVVGSQTITCSSDRSNPAVLKLHAIDSGGLDGGTDVASDGGTDAASDGGMDAASDGGPVANDGGPTPKPPSNVPVTCSIVFEKIQ